MTNHLSFLLQLHSHEGSRSLSVIPCINGVALDNGRSWVFDIARVIAWADARTDSDFYLYTCGCGAPGCAGIHEGCRLEISGNKVTWVIPQATRKGLESAFQGEGELRLEFDRKAYVRVLRRTFARMEACARYYKQQLQIPPSFRGDEEELSFGEFIRDLRPRMLTWHAREEWRKRVWEGYFDRRLQLEFADGLVAEIPLENLGDAIGDMSLFGFDAKQAAYIERDVAPALKGDLESVVAKARELPWGELVEYLFVSQASASGTALKNYYGREDWPEVKFSLVTAEW